MLLKMYNFNNIYDFKCRAITRAPSPAVYTESFFVFIFFRYMNTAPSTPAITITVSIAKNSMADTTAATVLLSIIVVPNWASKPPSGEAVGNRSVTIEALPVLPVMDAAEVVY